MARNGDLLTKRPETRTSGSETTIVRDAQAPTPEAIRARAFEIYVARGAAPGREVEDWIQAERDLRSRRFRTPK